ncbi:unnamed protein product [Rotaria sp. Silwood2]|nr:unnamed protein product [Rotaria sp. Silwood2]CAF3032682.1 unnamed protein product [Rotaria sp. Silwood2]CAF3219081.1 unnamed protein product [Rotaria sp. Silwood2]CAF3437092.1 unnamed protein product [Rotaria sp. Silwood2]CAF4204543.1 unnamed protein product [Rotaria sp. Silwood2]
MTNLIETLILITTWLNIIVNIFMCILGIIITCLAIYVFTRHRFPNSISTVYLLACSIACCIQLIQTFLPYSLSSGVEVITINSNN